MTYFHDYFTNKVFCGILYTPSNNTCVPAHPVPHRDTAKCQPYHRTTNGYCSKIIGSRFVYGSIANQKEKIKGLCCSKSSLANYARVPHSKHLSQCCGPHLLQPLLSRLRQHVRYFPSTPDMQGNL